jgi:hypothetical protein
MKLSEASLRKFKITASQYEMFRFVITQKAKLRVRLWATAPVNVLLLDSEDRAEFELNKSNYTYTAAWGRRSDLEATVPVEPGKWYLVVEGSTEPSSGRVEVLEE